MVWTRRTIGLLLGPLLFATVLAAPTGLEPDAHRLAAIFALVIVFWVTEAIPLAATALLGPALAVPFGVASAREAFASFGHPILFLFLGSFLIARPGSATTRAGSCSRSVRSRGSSRCGFPIPQRRR